MKLALLGFQPEEKLGHNIEYAIGVPDELANRLGADIRKFIFEPLHQKLDQSAAKEADAPATRSPSDAGEGKASSDDPGEPADTW